jgi:hypothetical protein
MVFGGSHRNREVRRAACLLFFERPETLQAERTSAWEAFSRCRQQRNSVRRREGFRENRLDIFWEMCRGLSGIRLSSKRASRSGRSKTVPHSTPVAGDSRRPEALSPLTRESPPFTGFVRETIRPMKRGVGGLSSLIETPSAIVR